MVKSQYFKNLWYLKLFYLAEFIVGNIKCLWHQVAKVKEYEFLASSQFFYNFLMGSRSFLLLTYHLEKSKNVNYYLLVVGSAVVVSVVVSKVVVNSAVVVVVVVVVVTSSGVGVDR